MVCLGQAAKISARMALKDRALNEEVGMKDGVPWLHWGGGHSIIRATWVSCSVRVSHSTDAILWAHPGIPELSESDNIPIAGGLCSSLKGFPVTTALINGSSMGSPSASSDLVSPVTAVAIYFGKLPC